MLFIRTRFLVVLLKIKGLTSLLLRQPAKKQ